MSDKLRPHYSDAKGVIVEDFERKGALASGATVPTDGTAGYAPGALFLKRSGTAGASLYINDGTATSCDFNPVGGAVVSGAARFAAGVGTLDGSNPTTIATGLTTILCAFAQLIGTAVAGSGDGVSNLQTTFSGGDLNVYAFQFTSGTDPTLTASTDSTATFSWVAFGL